jgi:hypothetical protein
MHENTTQFAEILCIHRLGGWCHWIPLLIELCGLAAPISLRAGQYPQFQWK